MKLMSIVPCVRGLFLFALFLLPAVTGRSQRYLGIATSERNAINSLYLNPANIAACREKLSIGIFSMSVAVDNNLGHIPKIPNLGETVNGNNNIFTRSKRSSFSMIVPAAVVRGPGIMASLSDKISIALTTGIRGFNQFHNFDPSLYKTPALPQSVADSNYAVKMHNFNWTAHMWSEVGLTLAGVVRKGEKYSLNLGGTIRRLGGIGYLSMRGVNLDVKYKKGTDLFQVANSNIDFGTNVLNDSSAVFKDITPAGLLKTFFATPPGYGVSADIGFTLRYHIGEADPSDYMESNQTHDIVFSMAVTDWGAITYNNSTSAAAKISGQGTISGQGLDSNVNDAASLIAYAKKQGFGIDTHIDARRVHLPTALVASVDVQVYGRFYANLLFVGNMANRNEFGNSYYDQFTFTPRYDYHKMTISLPLTYGRLAHDFKMGIACRYKGFFIGSDDVLASISKCQYGFGLYLGGYIPIFKKKYDPAGLHWGS
jgi:Family of unknown function (DUF5723)